MMFLRKFVLLFFVIWLGYVTTSLWSAAAGVPDPDEVKGLDELPGEAAVKAEKYYDFIFERKESDQEEPQSVRFSSTLVDLSTLLKNAVDAEVQGDPVKEEFGSFPVTLDKTPEYQGFSLQDIHDLLEAASKNKLKKLYETKTFEEMIKIAALLNYLGAPDGLDQITYALAKAFSALANPLDPETGIMSYEKQIIPAIQALIVDNLIKLKPANLFSKLFIKRWKLRMYADFNKVLQGHESNIRSVSWSPDGQQLASGSSDNTIRIWDVTTGKLEKTLDGHTNWVNSVSWSPDGQQLASGSGDKTIRIWDVATWQLEKTLEGHTDPVVSVSWHRDGKQLASGSVDKTIRIWDVATGDSKKILGGHASSIRSVCWSPNGKQLASGSSGHSIRIWDVASGKPEQSLEWHKGPVTSVSWSLNGEQLLSGSEDQTIRIWNVATGKMETTLRGHASPVYSVAWSPSEKHLASGSKNTTIGIWDVAMRVMTRALKGHTEQVNSVSWSPDGKQLASGSNDKTIRIWNMNKALKKSYNMTFAELIDLLSPKVREEAAAEKGVEKEGEVKP